MWIESEKLEQELAEDGAALGLAPEMSPGEGGEGGESVEPSTYLRDLTEDDVYSRLQSVADLPQRLNAAESRMFGSLSPLTERLSGLEKSLGSRATVNTEALKGLAEYDEKLAEVAGKVFPEAFNSAPLDEEALRPFLDPMREQMQDYIREQIVLAFYTPERINEIVPAAKDGVHSPEGAEQEDFVNWLAQQGYNTQQAVQTLGPQYVRAMQQFEKWREGQVKERESAAAKKASALAGGGQPSANGRRSPGRAGPQTADEAFSKGFADVMKARQR